MACSPAVLYLDYFNTAASALTSPTFLLTYNNPKLSHLMMHVNTQAGPDMQTNISQQPPIAKYRSP